VRGAHKRGYGTEAHFRVGSAGEAESGVKPLTATPEPSPRREPYYGCVKMGADGVASDVLAFLKLPASIRVQLNERAATTPWVGNP
jgi:hypothetical protein